MPKRHGVKGGALALLCAGAMLAPLSAEAVRTKLGEVEISLDSTVRLGGQLRVQEQDCNLLWPGVTALGFDPAAAAAFPGPPPGAHVGGNGGCRRAPLFSAFDFSDPELIVSPFGAPLTFIPTSGTPAAPGITADNGNLSVDAGQFISAAVSGTHELEVRWRNFGVFVRGIWFYDYIYTEEESEFKPWGPAVRDDLGSEAELRDFFAFVDFDIGKVPITLRVGPQVVNWGESTFIQGGINSFQPIDVSVLRSPGVNLREAYEPLPMVYVQAGLTPNLSIEGFWNWAYAETDIDPAGSYFSTDDIAGPGARGALNSAAADPQFFNPDFFFPLANPFTPVFVRRHSDLGQDETGNFGVAARYFADWLNNGTDIGLYYTRHTSRLPFLTFAGGHTAAPPPINPLGTPLTVDQACAQAINLGLGIPAFDLTDTGDLATALGACLADPVISGGAVSAGAFGLLLNETRLAYDFPADIDMIGLSFSTVFGETAVSGDFAFYPDLPLARPQLTEIGCGNVSAAELTAGVQALVDAGAFGPIVQNGNIGDLVLFSQGDSPCIDPAPAESGEFAKAYGEEDTLVGQFTSVSTFRESNWLSRSIGADQTIAVLNLGFMWIPDMPDPLTERPYAMAQSTTFHPNPRVAAVFVAPGATLGNEGASDPDDGFADGFSAGFTFVVAPEYNNIFNTSIKATPSFVWRYDFFGDSPGPLGPGFIQEQMQVNLGVTFEYLNSWQLRFGYTNFFGGGYQNQRSDRDFVSGTLSYSF
ncbi:MAG: DUF1302 family protein [Alphaproteobacteria bacterium]